MKKILVIIVTILAVGIVYYFYNQSDRHKLEHFANELVVSSIPIDSILSDKVKYSDKQKDFAFFFLKNIREEYNKNPEKIKVIAANEYAKVVDNNIKLNTGKHLYYISFTESLTLPFIINNKSEIILLFILSKGNGGYLNNSRSDDIKL